MDRMNEDAFLFWTCRFSSYFSLPEGFCWNLLGTIQGSENSKISPSLFLVVFNMIRFSNWPCFKHFCPPKWTCQIRNYDQTEWLSDPESVSNQNRHCHMVFREKLYFWIGKNHIFIHRFSTCHSWSQSGISSKKNCGDFLPEKKRRHSLDLLLILEKVPCEEWEFEWCVFGWSFFYEKRKSPLRKSSSESSGLNLQLHSVLMWWIVWKDIAASWRIWPWKRRPLCFSFPENCGVLFCDSILELVVLLCCHCEISASSDVQPGLEAKHIRIFSNILERCCFLFFADG